MFLPKYSQKGETIISLLVALAVFSILIQTLFTLVSTSYKVLSFNKARIAARHIAQEEIETVRNMPYDDVGTSGGIPDGSLLQEKTLVRNGQSFTIKTAIVYIDDPFGINITDYKRARVEVSWGGLGGGSSINPVSYITNITPKTGTESDGGNLTIQVFNANGEPVAQALVTVLAPELDVNLSQTTDNNGRMTLPGAQECVACYRITVTKAGYSSERTYSIYEVANPLKPHMTVLNGQISQISFNIDLLSNLTVNTKGDRLENFSVEPNVAFDIRGSKIIGTDPYLQPIYKYEQSFTTNETGTILIEDIEWDIYTISIPELSSFDISGSTPLNPLVLNPNTSIDFDMALTASSNHNLLSITKDTGQNLLGEVNVRIYDDLGYESSTVSGVLSNPDFGQLHFPGLEEKIYHLQATASGYLENNRDVYVSGNTIENIILSQ